MITILFRSNGLQSTRNMETWNREFCFTNEELSCMEKVGGGEETIHQLLRKMGT